MAISIKRTSALTQGGVKILAYGQAGAGKTTLIASLPTPITLSAEGGLLALQGADLPFIEIGSMADLHEAYSWLVSSEEAKAFASIAIDSISEIAEVCLIAEKRTAKDPRQAYGAMIDQMTEVIRAFRDLPRHVYVSAKLDKSADELGKVSYAPSMPGAKLGQALPYFFDEVLALRVERSEAGEPVRGLQTSGDGIWTAKDRSGRLDAWEPADLGAIIAKIGGSR
jgi:phage nucleotide-binding protein